MSKGSAIRSELEALMRQRILVIDGAMGTTIREYKAKGELSETIARGTRFAKNEKDLLNNGDILSITAPSVIEDSLRRFLEAGADIFETNTFGATSVAPRDAAPHEFRAQPRVERTAALERGEVRGLGSECADLVGRLGHARKGASAVRGES